MCEVGQSCSSLTVRAQMSPLPTRAIGLFDVRCVYSCESYRLDDFIIPSHPHVFRFLDVLKGGPNIPQPTKTPPKKCLEMWRVLT